MANPFRKMRGIPDRTLTEALTNHKANIEGLVVWAAAYQRRMRRVEYAVVVLMVVVLGLVVEALALPYYVFGR